MDNGFLNDDFLLTTGLARRLYHGCARQQPVFDYHCHLPVQPIAENARFENLTQAWLAGDHYKWRAMRWNGVAERFCTGDASDEEKFFAWAATVPYTIGNPLCVWTHLELRRAFGVTAFLNPGTARRIYDECSEKLRSPGFSVRGLMRRFGVRAVCTTDDPADDLRHHRAIARSGFEVRVLPTFRPDRVAGAGDPVAYNLYLDRLAAAAGVDIRDYESLLDAVRKRHAFFHEHGCRLSDHGLETVCPEPCTGAEAAAVFAAVRAGRQPCAGDLLKLRSALLHEFGRMDAERGWTMQLHIGALRNNNSRKFAELGPDSGFDSIGDRPVARDLSRFLDALDREGRLPRTILYTLNPAFNEVLAAMAGNFQDGITAGKIQFGSAWWFLDQRDGMEKQMTSLAGMGLLRRFVGMLTDSRSFLSYPRHEYFRRTLCKLLGEWAALGEIPGDEELLMPMVADICFGNAQRYFGIEGI